MGSSSVESEVIAAVATISMSVDNVQSTENGEIPDYLQVLKEETVRKRIADNGFALRRTLMGETIKGYYPSPLTMEEMSIADVMSEIPDEDLPFVSSVKNRIYMPAEFFQKWVRRPLECKKHPNNPKTENCQGAWKLQCLPPFLTNRSWTGTSPPTAT
jgi:hypothetical protein